MDPLRENAHGGLAMERKAYGLDATEVLQRGSWTAMERGARMTGLLREAERQTRMNRVDPRGQLEEQMQLVEQKANGLDATEALQEGGRTATERGAQMTGLLREAERQTDQL